MSTPAGTRAIVQLLGEWRHDGRAHAELADKLHLLLIDGRIRSGTRLPPERAFASAVGVSRTTITTAYQSLRERGILRSVQGSGSVLELPRNIDEDSTLRPDSIDLSKALPDAWPGITDYVARAAEKLPEQLAARMTIDFWGLQRLRELIADRYTSAGAPTSPDEILVTRGAQHAIALVAQTLLGRGDRVVVESPSYPHALDAFRMVGARMIASPVGERSLDLADFEAILRDGRPTLAYLMPDFHNPTSVSMPDIFRERLLEMAGRTGTALVIDETTADLDIDRPFATTPFAAIAQHGTRVVTIGSMSKTVWGGLRIGWIRAERHLIDRFVAIRPSTDMGNAILEQLIAIEAFPDLPTILSARRGQLSERRDHLVGLLADALPSWHADPIHGGLALWINLGAPLSSALAMSARALGVTITAGSRFGIDGAFERYLRLPITLPMNTLTDAVARLASAWDSVGRSSSGSSALESAFVV